MRVALRFALAFLPALAFADYTIQTNSPVIIQGTGTEVVLIYGGAPVGSTVYVTIQNVTYEGATTDGGYQITIPADMGAGTWPVTGIWEIVSGDITTTGHLTGTSLTISMQNGATRPVGIVTIHEGAHANCENCITYEGMAIIPAGDAIQVINADSEKHQFKSSKSSTGNLDAGESIRMSVITQGMDVFTCIYHPWLSFEVRGTGEYHGSDESGAITLDMPDKAGESVRIGITYTGKAQLAHIVAIQKGQILDAKSLPLTDGYGVVEMDAREWLVGDVIISASVGDDHTTGVISILPPTISNERVGIVTGYVGLDGILIDGIPSHPTTIKPYDMAGGVVRELCPVGSQAVFLGDTGLISGAAVYEQGLVTCGGVNLGIYLLESNLATPDDELCLLSDMEYMIPYCFPEEPAIVVATPEEPPEVVIPEIPVVEEEVESGEPNIVYATPDKPPEATDDIPDDVYIPSPSGADFDDSNNPADDILDDIQDAIPECDFVTDPTCPCPEGMIRDGEWCTTEETVKDVIDDTSKDLAADLKDLFGQVGGYIMDFVYGLYQMLMGVFGFNVSGTG